MIINMNTTVTWFLKRATQGLIRFNKNKYSASRWPQPGCNFRSHLMMSTIKSTIRWHNTRRTFWTQISLRTQLSSSYHYTETTLLTISMNNSSSDQLLNSIRAIMSIMCGRKPVKGSLPPFSPRDSRGSRSSNPPKNLGLTQSGSNWIESCSWLRNRVNLRWWVGTKRKWRWRLTRCGERGRWRSRGCRTGSGRGAVSCCNPSGRRVMPPTPGGSCPMSHLLTISVTH